MDNRYQYFESSPILTKHLDADFRLRYYRTNQKINNQP